MTAHSKSLLPSHAILSAEEREIAMAVVEEQFQQGQVSFELAHRLTGLEPELLRKLVRDGVIAGIAPYRVDGVVGTCDITAVRNIAQQLIEARQAVEGNSILVPLAIQKYGFSKKGVYSWIKSGRIRKCGTDQNGDTLINEGDIAFARILADLTNHRKAKALFPKS